MPRIFISNNKSELFNEVDFCHSKGIVTDKIAISTQTEYQTIDGFGASFTDSAAYLIDQVLNNSDKESVMNKLFSRETGIGLSMIRNPMGASDYARYIYSYNDLGEGQEDVALDRFSIDHDKESIIPLTAKALELNPDLKVIASPWSAPGWMKSSGKMVTGKLLKEYYPVYANYFVKFIEAYRNYGINIYGVTPQNEPLFEPTNYPSMEMLSHESIDFVKNYLKPAFLKYNLTTKIFGYDHNWDRIDYALALLDDGEDSFDGIAWHWYGGKPVTQSRVKNIYPNKEVHFTEGSGGEWIPEFEPAFSNVMRTGIEIMRNYSKSFVLWNMALDESNGPVVQGFGKSTCRGLLRINQIDKTYTYTLDYYALAHFSKYVFSGAKRIESTQDTLIKNTAFKNIDGSIVSVLFNDYNIKRVVEIKLNEDKKYILDMKPKSAATLIIE